MPEMFTDHDATIDAGLALEREGNLEGALQKLALAVDDADPAMSAIALTHIADVQRCRTDWEAALDAARRAQRLARSVGREELMLDAAIAEANVLMCRGDFDDAVPLFVDVLRRTHDARVRGIALQNLGSILAQRGQLDEAERAFGESSECFAACGYRRGEAIALNNQGRAALDGGDHERADVLLDRARAIAAAVGDAELIALTQLNRGEALLGAGDVVTADGLACAALGYFVAAGNRWREVECLRLMGAIHERRGDGPSARRCYLRGLHLAEDVETPVEWEKLRACLARLEAGVE